MKENLERFLKDKKTNEYLNYLYEDLVKYVKIN